jgi:hypothetical protein
MTTRCDIARRMRWFLDIPATLTPPATGYRTPP